MPKVRFTTEDKVTADQAIMLQHFMSGFGSAYIPTGSGFLIQLIDTVCGREVISGVVHIHLETRKLAEIVAVACTDPWRTEYRTFWSLLDEAKIERLSTTVLFRSHETENKSASHVMAWCTTHGMVVERVDEDRLGNSSVKLSGNLRLLACLSDVQETEEDDGVMTTYIPPNCTERQVRIANQCMAHMKIVYGVSYAETFAGKRLVARGPARVGTKRAAKHTSYFNPVVG